MICETGDCKGKPKYECPECGNTYCEECAVNSDFKCPFESHKIPELRKIK